MELIVWPDSVGYWPESWPEGGEAAPSVAKEALGQLREPEVREAESQTSALWYRPILNVTAPVG